MHPEIEYDALMNSKKEKCNATWNFRYITKNKNDIKSLYARRPYWP